MTPRGKRAARWIKQHQHVPVIRLALDATERAYEIAGHFSAQKNRPAIAGGRPARFLPFPAPKPYTRHERRELARVVRTHNASFFDGGAVQRFEAGLAARWKCRHAIAVSSGTAALHAALIAAEIGPGDEVIVPVLTYVSTALAVLYQRAVPRFVDAHPSTWNIDPARIEAALTPRTKAILVVHLAGVPCDMDAIGAIAAKHGLLLVEDAAQAHGAAYGGRQVGTIGHLGCFSFQSAKSMTTGEGGAVLTDDDALARRVRLAMNLGEVAGRARPTLEMPELGPDAELTYELLGWNYRMSALQAAVGLGQLAHLDAICAARNRNAEVLARELAQLPGVVRQGIPQAAAPCFSSFFVELSAAGDGPGRDELALALARERIDFRLPYRRPLAAHAIFGARGEFPVAERLCRETIGFRVDPSLGPREMRAIGFALRRLWAWKRSP